MHVRKFEGDTLDEAIKAVKRELGPDAIILKTVTNKGLKGAFKKNRIEITAAVSEQNLARKTKVDHVLSDEQKEGFYNAPTSDVNKMINQYNDNKSPSNSGYGNIGLNRTVKTQAKLDQESSSSLDDFLSTNDDFEDESSFEDSFSSSLEKSAQGPAVSNTYSQELEEELKAHRHSTEKLKSFIETQSRHIEALEEKIFDISKQVQSNNNSESKSEVGIEELTLSLRTLGLNEVIIKEVVKKAYFDLSNDQLNDPEITLDFALKDLSEKIHVEQSLFSKLEDKVGVCALISETPSGQSSMAIKLATLFQGTKLIRFRENDVKKANYTFAKNLFKIDFVEVSTLSELMSEARKSVSLGQSIILDIKLDQTKFDETKKLISSLNRSFEDIEVLLNLSGINSEIYNRKILSKYREMVNGVTINYIDQCLDYSTLVNLNYKFKELPLKFFGTGKVIPDDIEAASAERILAGMFQL